MALSIASIKKQIGEYLFKRSQKKIAQKTVLEGYDVFEKTGITPDQAYQSMVSLFCLTNGSFNESFHKKIMNRYPAYKVTGTLNGVLGNIDHAEFVKMNTALNTDGYLGFEKKLSSAICTRIYNAALKFPTVVKGYEEKIKYEPEKTVSEIYRIRSVDMMNNPDIQALIADPTLINIARNYFGCEPIFDFPAMWWSTAFSKKASEDAAQLYHFDMDRIKWLKIFFYINDVTDKNGPHSYIRGTHLPSTKPADILARGYVRVTDEELRQHYPSDDFKVILGEAGAIFAGDTKCWHKGTPLLSGHRIVLELEYTTSLFGVNYPKLSVTQSSPEFREFCSQNTVYSSNIIFENASAQE